MRTLRTVLAIAILFMATGFSFGQEMKAEKYEDPQWVMMAQIKFKPMKKDAAMSIVHNYFVKADEDAGIEPPTTFHMVGGDYDMIVVWDMKEGVETLNYKMTPDDVKWMQSMAKVAGGQDKAMAKLDEFMSYVDTWENSLARRE